MTDNIGEVVKQKKRKPVQHFKPIEARFYNPVRGCNMKVVISFSSGKIVMQAFKLKRGVASVCVESKDWYKSVDEAIDGMASYIKIWAEE